MQVIPPNLHIGSNMLKPLYSLLIMGFAVIIVGLLITRSLPRFLAELITIVLALGTVVLWGWLTFYVHIFPGI